MKNLLLLTALVAAWAASAPLAHATPAASDSSAAQMTRTLAVTGQIAVAQVGNYVHAGSFRIWVSSHLGRPNHVLPDGTWLYENRGVEDSTVAGTLAISFQKGRVSAMRLISPAMAVALLHPAKPAATLVASR